MSAFESIKFDLKSADAELISFKSWLAAVTFVGETVIVAEIKKRRHMACLLASTLGLPAPDMIKFELALKGMFRTDLVLGNDGQRRFGLIEFEDAEPNSIFKRGTAQYRSWSPRLEHGFSQILDWAWVRSDHPNDSVLLAGFGGPITTSAYAASSADAMRASPTTWSANGQASARPPQGGGAAGSGAHLRRDGAKHGRQPRRREDLGVTRIWA